MNTGDASQDDDIDHGPPADSDAVPPAGPEADPPAPPTSRAGADRVLLLDDVIEGIGVGRFHYELLLLCGLGWMSDGVEKCCLSYLLPILQTSWGLETWQLGLLSSTMGVGQCLGAAFWGCLSDRIGRRHGFLLSLSSTFVLGLVTCAAPAYWTFLLLRFGVAFGIGGTLPVDFTVMAEYLPQSKRTRWLAILYTFYGLGRMVASVMAWLLLPVHWRWFLFCVAMPCGVLLVLRRRVPETPKYLLAIGKVAQARQVLEKVAAKNGMELPQGVLALPPPIRRATVWELLETSFLRTTLLLWVLWTFLGWGTEWTQWIPLFLAKQHFSETAQYHWLMVLNTHEMAAPVMILWAQDCISRRATLILWGGLAGTAVAVYAWLVSVGASIYVGAPAAFFGAFSTIVMWITMYIWTPELYPTRLRATGFGCAMAFNRGASILAPLAIALCLHITPEPPWLPIAMCSCCFMALALTAPWLRGTPVADEALQSARDVNGAARAAVQQGEPAGKDGALGDTGASVGQEMHSVVGDKVNLVV